MEETTAFAPLPNAPISTGPAVIEVRERSTGKKFAEALLSLLFPPLALFVHDNLECNRHTAINVLLCILGFWICGIIHSVWYCFIRG